MTDLFRTNKKEVCALLVDQFNRPIKRQELEKPFAPPSLGGVRSVISGHPAEGLTPRRLSGLLRAAAEGEPEAYLELAEDMEEREPHYLAVLSTRKRQVAQLPITVEAASDDKTHIEHADFIQSWLDEEILRASLFDFLDAIGKGYSIMEIEWRMQHGYLLPRDLVWRPQRWFTPLREDGETLTLREGGENRLLPPHQFIIHRHASKSGLTVRGGLARIIAWAWMYKSYTLKDWAIFVQNFGMPIRIGRYNTTATEKDINVLWRAVKNVAGDMAAIIPENMRIEFQEVAAKGTTVELYERRADWFDRQVSKVALGQTTTTDAVSGGHAVAQEHRLVQEDIERSDAALLSATINRQLIPNIIAFNFGPQDHYPKARIGRPDELSIEKIADAIAKLGPLGLTVEASWLRDRIGAPDPEKGAELVGGRSPAQALFDRADDTDTKPQLNTARTLHARQSREETEVIIDRLTRRMEDDTAGVMAGLTDEIRQVLMTSESLGQAAERLAELKLDPAELSNAMARGMALAHLAGQAALLDELAKQK